jgi:chromosome partitioning protein
MYDNRTNLSKDVKDELEKFMSELVFKSIIPRNIKLSEAPSRGLSIFDYAPNSIGADSYRNLAQEILDRIYKNKLIKPLSLDIKT